MQNKCHSDNYNGNLSLKRKGKRNGVNDNQTVKWNTFYCLVDKLKQDNTENALAVNSVLAAKQLC